VGSTFDITESCPNRCTTMPDGGGVGSCRAVAIAGNPAARLNARPKILIVTVFLRPRLP
jgi:hypothetical protein